MTETLHADIFFFITSVAVVAVTLMALVALWYVIAILREVRKVATNISRASDGFERDIERVRGEVRKGSSKVVSWAESIGNSILSRFSKPKRRSNTKKKPVSEDTAHSVY